MQMNYFKAALFLIFSAFLPFQAQAADFQSCGECHEASLNGEMHRLFLHAPFAKVQCGACHLAKASTLTLKKEEMPGVPAGRVNHQRLIRLAQNSTALTEHAFLLPKRKVSDTLIVDLHGSKGQFSRHEIVVPPLAGLPEPVDSANPPVISEVQVLKVHRGALLTATISWQTDTVTDARVLYGIDGLQQKSESGKHLGRRHQVLLYNLQPDETYNFSVVSEDLYNRRQVSGPHTFSTSKSFTASPPDDLPNNLPAESATRGMTSIFSRFGSDYLFELSLARPALVLVSSRKKSPSPQQPDHTRKAASGGAAQAVELSSTEDTTGTAKETDGPHSGLSGKTVISMTACQGCHRTRCRHPVYVVPKEGMIISPEYPTLQDGRISCISCHQPHAANHDYLTRKYYKRSLCIGCHQDKQ